MVAWVGERDGAEKPWLTQKQAETSAAVKAIQPFVVGFVVVLWLLATPMLLFSFGSVKIVNQTDTPITSGVLTTFHGERRIGPVAPGLAWSVDMQNARGELLHADSGYYSPLLDGVAIDIVVVTPDTVLVDGEPQ